MPPRPILKGLPSSDPSFASSEAASNPLPFSSCSTMLDSPHVHFPPTPTLTSTEITHSSFIYDRAPIVVTPNTCALPERGGRKFIGPSNSNLGGLGYFHPHAKFQVDAVRVERDSSETVSPTIFSASVTVGNVNECGSVGLFMKKWSGPVHEYEYEYDQYPSHDQHTQHVLSPFIFDCSSGSSDLGVFCSTPAPYVPTSPLSSTCSPSPSSIPHSSVNPSTQKVYNTSTAPPSPSFAVNNNMASNDNDYSYPNQFISHTHIGVHDASSHPSSSKQFDQLNVAIPVLMATSSSISTSGFPMKPRDKHQDKKKSLVDSDGKRRRRNKEYTHNRTEGDQTGVTGTQWTMVRPKDSDTSCEFELEGCLGGF